jgi:hypothetical protein
VYYAWGQRTDYDVLEKYYPKALRRKFAWVRNDIEEEAHLAAEDPVGESKVQP